MSTKSVLIVSVTVFLDMLGFGILVPLVPMLIIHPHNLYALLSPDVSSNVRYILLGFLIALFPLTQFFATPILGDISDTIGRKKVLVFSIVGTTVSYLLMISGLFMHSVLLLLLARAVDGVSGGNLSVAQAVIADVSTKETRAKNFAVLSAAFGLGFVLGPIIGTHLHTGLFGLYTPFIFAALLSGVNAILIYLFLDETKKLGKKTSIRWHLAMKHIQQSLLIKGTRLYFAVNFLLQGAFATFTAFLSVFVVSRTGLTDSQFGFVLSYLGVWMVIGQLSFTKPIVKLFGELEAFYISLMGLSITTILLFLAHSFASFLIITPFISIFLGLSQALLLSLVSASATKSQQGEVLGINTSVTALAQTLPPILGGIGAAAFAPSTPIVFAAVSSFVASLLVKRRVKLMQ